MSTAPHRPRVTRLAPFNRHRYDLCIAYVMKVDEQPLDDYELTKIHALIDGFHVASTGLPVIGGSLDQWPRGPVCPEANTHVVSLLESRLHPEPLFEVVKGGAAAKADRMLGFSKKGEVDKDDFSVTELDAIEHARRVFNSMTRIVMYEYFHNPKHFLGHAWTKAKNEHHKSLDWHDILDGYEAEFNTKLTIARLTIGH